MTKRAEIELLKRRVAELERQVAELLKTTPPPDSVSQPVRLRSWGESVTSANLKQNAAAMCW